MEDQTNTGMAIFRQVCEVNELDPDQVIKKVQQHASAPAQESAPEEKLIRAALEQRASLLLGSINIPATEATDAFYKIDSDPAAPSFQIKEDAIRSKYNPNEAEKIIEVLGQVKLPVQG